MKRLPLYLFLLGATLLVFTLGFTAFTSHAAPFAQETTPVPNLSISDEYCLSCHGQPGQTFPLEDGSELDLYVDPAEHANSVHGSQGYACVQCHTDVGEYPHPPFSAANRRQVTLKLNQLCQRCHASQHDLNNASVHARAQTEGNTAAAVCTDCHTAHAVEKWVDSETRETLPEARLRIPQTCALCHNAIYQQYQESVHGSALTNENNPDVPTCIDCHGVHNIQDPTTNEFRNNSPEMCANCHTDPARMTKYGISTDVLATYVDDFHGTTVAIYEKQSPGETTNKPVCYDCHGVHDIKRADDPEKGLQVKENMLAVCQKCHPDAQENFPTAWLSHYIPSPDKYALVYYVNLFYKFFIPTVLGGMVVLVAMDFSRSAINRNRKRRQEAALVTAVEVPAEAVAVSTAPIEEIALVEPDTGITVTPEQVEEITAVEVETGAAVTIVHVEDTTGVEAVIGASETPDKSPGKEEPPSTFEGETELTENPPTAPEEELEAHDQIPGEDETPTDKQPGAEVNHD